MQKFHSLLKDKYHIELVTHNREPELINNIPIRGKTTITISTPESGDEAFTGIAYCSIKDNFNKKVGYGIALGRALKEAYEYLMEEKQNV
jgi:hypothetical protein